MKIQSVHIRNYRKLKNCHIDLGDQETILVGANNSGKTSAISAIVWFLRNIEKFTLKEFTATNWVLINKIGEKWLENDPVDEALLSPQMGRYCAINGYLDKCGRWRAVSSKSFDTINQYLGW